MSKKPCWRFGPAGHATYRCEECRPPDSGGPQATCSRVEPQDTVSIYPVCTQCHRVHTYMRLRLGAPPPPIRPTEVRGCLLRTHDRLGLLRLFGVCERCGDCAELTVRKAPDFAADPLCEVCIEEEDSERQGHQTASRLRAHGYSVAAHFDEDYRSD